MLKLWELTELSALEETERVQITDNLKGSDALKCQTTYRSADNRLMIPVPSTTEASSVPDPRR